MKLSLLLSFISCAIVSFGQTELITYEQPLPCLNQKFTIVANVVQDEFGQWNTTEQEILDNVAEMNRYFEPICVSFEVCEFRSVANYQLDTLEGDEGDQLDIEQQQAYRINMFFVQDIANQDIAACGYAAGSIGLYTSGGIVIKKGACNSPGTFTHEMGHYFGLLHTFEGNGEELVNGDNCDTAGDLICDTEADNYDPSEDPSLYVDGNCRFINIDLDANGDYYRPDVGNIMSYYGGCRCGFTTGQYLRMAERIVASKGKMW
jgi:hypothetical protein